MKNIKEKVCEFCLDSGEMVIAAHEEGGQIVDEERSKCVCRINYHDHE